MAEVAQQIGSPMELYHKPANLFVAGFIGSPKMNFVDGKVSCVDDCGLTISTSETDIFALQNAKGGIADGDSVTLGIRLHDLEMSPERIIKGRVLLVERLGNETVVNFSLKSGLAWLAVLDGDVEIAAGATISLDCPADKLVLFDDKGLAVD